MSKNTHTVHPELIKTVDYEILVLGLPKKDLEDLLTHFVPERGKISRSLYEDFLIANCIANLNQFMAHINTATISGDIDLLKLRQEITEIVLTHNPLLHPEKVVINKNQVLKLLTNTIDDAEDDDIGGILLNENIYWNKSYYDTEGNYKPIALQDDAKNHMEKPSAKKTKPATNDTEKKDISELEWKPVQVWWPRLNEYVVVKQFSLTDIDHILRKRYFHNSTSFNTYIVSSCILEVENIYELIDGMGANVDPNKVIRELFALCEGVNEGLNFTRAKELQGPDEDSNNTAGPRTSSPAQRAAYTKGYGKKKATKKLPSFKDVPKADLLKLADNMKVSLVGQDEAINKLGESIKRASVGLKDPIKPIGSFLFAGRTGCGKTLASKVLADELIRTRKNRIVIDCSEYTNDHEYAKLIGAPAGYIGHDDGGVLTNAVAETPFAVVVFDEIEKASSKVYDLLLQVLDEGRLTDGKGRAVSFRDTIIVLTSNIGVQEVDEVTKTIGFGDVAVLTEDKKIGALNRALKKKFKPEFLNRIDSVVHFKDLSDEDYMKIIDIELYKLSDNLKSNDTEYKDVTLNFDKKIRKLIFKEGVDEKFGARPIKRAIEQNISSDIAGLLLEGDFSPYVTINVSEKKGKVVLTTEDKEDKQKINLMANQ